MATVSLSALSRKERQKTNLGGLAKIVLFGASDFTGEWPAEADVVSGVVTTALPLKNGATGAVLLFDTGTGVIKHNKKGKLGYQVYEHEMSAEFAGYEAAQKASLQKTINEGGVAIGYLKNGKRIVAGTSYMPLVFEEDGTTGSKSDDGGKMSLKAKIEDGIGFAPPELADTVTIALPA